MRFGAGPQFTRPSHGLREGHSGDNNPSVGVGENDGLARWIQTRAIAANSVADQAIRVWARRSCTELLA